MRCQLALVLVLSGCSSSHKVAEPQPQPVPTYSPVPKRVYADVCDETFARACDMEVKDSPGGQRCISAHIEKFTGDCLRKLTMKGPPL